VGARACGVAEDPIENTNGLSRRRANAKAGGWPSLQQVIDGGRQAVTWDFRGRILGRSRLFWLFEWLNNFVCARWIAFFHRKSPVLGETAFGIRNLDPGSRTK
jgi:hypothetical protein